MHLTETKGTVFLHSAQQNQTKIICYCQSFGQTFFSKQLEEITMLMLEVFKLGLQTSLATSNF